MNLATTGKAGSLAAAEVLAEVAASSDKPVVVFSSTPVDQIRDALHVFAEAGIPVLPSPERAATALAALVKYREAQKRLGRLSSHEETNAAAKVSVDLPHGGRSGTSLSEHDSKAILADAGIPVTTDFIVNDAASDVFDKVTAPLVVKVLSRDIPHKTEIGGVKVGIRTRAELETAIGEVLANARRHAAGARIEGVLVSEMVSGGFELIAGVVNDVVFGPVVVVGAGGIYAELLRDTVCRLAPFDEETAREMLDELKCRPILDGARGRPPLDAGAAAKALAALSQFAWRSRDTVGEIDINPLFVLPTGVVAADALIVLRERAVTPAVAELVAAQASV
jgi:acetyltransferase